MQRQLKGKVAIVTGGAAGFGEGIVRLFVAQGARVVIADLDASRGEKLAAELGETARFVRTDVSSGSDVNSLVQTCSREFGDPDIVINNAGTTHTNRPMLEVDEQTFDRMFAVNVRSHWLLAKACFPLLREAQGKVVFTTSISGTNPTTPLGAYSPCKAALLMLMRQLSVEWAPKGIRVNAVSPGMTLTPGTSVVYQDPQVRQQREARIPARRIGTPQDIAGAVAYLLGPDADYVHGVELLVDGGLDKTVMVNPVMDGWRTARPQSGAN